MDEHRIGLNQLLRRCWIAKEQRPQPQVQHRYE